MMMSTERQCLTCEKDLEGRLDQKFCSKQCRNNFNNAKYRETEQKMREVIKMLKTNRKIVMGLLSKGQTPYTRDELKNMGYNLDYYTNTWSENTNNTYFFCFDYGLLSLHDQDQYIPVAWQSYMG